MARRARACRTNLIALSIPFSNKECYYSRLPAGSDTLNLPPVGIHAS
jgi:hypothetical protein